MEIIQDLLVLIALAFFSLVFACLGSRILRSLRFRIENSAEYLLVSVGLGLVCTEVPLFLVQFTQRIRLGNLLVISLLCIPLLSESAFIFRKLAVIADAFRSSSAVRIVFVVGAVLSVEFLTSMAPLVGSDALHYHFAVQKLILNQGFHPLFSNSHSFLCGQHHLLILLGLSLGSEKLSLGFIFLGGVLSVAVLTTLAFRWATARIVGGIGLLLLVTPIVFWQMCSSGSPDIYMDFFAGAVLIVLFQPGDTGTWQKAFVAGFLAGGIAGAKYTGSFIAIAILVAVIIEFRSINRSIMFVLGSLIGGIWLYLRNAIWTGNPVFPFLSEQLSSSRLVSNYALTSLANDTGAAAHHKLTQLIPFVFFAAMNPGSPGFWDFFGPTVFALAPLVLLACRNTREWRVALVIWFISSTAIFFGSGLPRFLLPLFLIALFCVAGAIEYSLQQEWRIANAVSLGTLVIMIATGIVGLTLYCPRPLLAAVGFTRHDAYLNGNSQDYQAVQAINQVLGKSSGAGRALVFLRHLYYLNVPYLNGDPATSFEVDPEKLKTPEDWKTFFTAKGITYVVRAPDYPDAIAPALNELEKQGDLAVFAVRNVDNLLGMRIERVHTTISVTILKVTCR